jgi:hypothetical protein
MPVLTDAAFVVDTGTIAASGDTVTLTGYDWLLAGIQVGDTLSIGTKQVFVKEVVSATSLKTAPAIGTVAAGSSYAILRMPGDSAEVSALLRQLLATYPDAAELGALAEAIEISGGVVNFVNAPTILGKSLPWRNGVRSFNSAFVPVASNQALFPFDDTIPQSNEGGELITATITPISTTAKLRIEYKLPVYSAAVNAFIAAVFLNSGTDALHATVAHLSSAYTGVLHGVFEHVPGSIAPQTYKLRGGTTNAGAWSVNGQSASRLFGGVSRLELLIDQIRE